MERYSNRFTVVVLMCLKEIIFYISSLLQFLSANIRFFAAQVVIWLRIYLWAASVAYYKQTSPPYFSW